MDQSYSESDISMSPSQILERLRVLRQLQLMQRGKLQKQRLQYQESPESSSCITELISHFTNSGNSTSYNTFRSLLQSPQNGTSEVSPRLTNTSDVSQKVQDKDLIDGVSVLNLSQESEFIITTPTSSRSRASANSKPEIHVTLESHENNNNKETNYSKKKHISLDDMPILSPRKDFETLVLEKLQKEGPPKTTGPKKVNGSSSKKPFLRRGEGMARFGVKKNDLKIMNTKSLPWRKNNGKLKQSQIKIQPVQAQSRINHNPDSEKLEIDIVIPPLKLNSNQKVESEAAVKNDNENHQVYNNPNNIVSTNASHSSKQTQEVDTSNCSLHSDFKVPDKIIQQPKGKHPVQARKGKTWASILTAEQSDFLTKLKQSEYYKNFESPTKSIVSNVSCDENTNMIRQEREVAEQNLFELLENKVSNDSFSMNTSFINRFLRRTHLECSGESTPIIMQKCLSENPNLMHIFPDTNNHHRHESYNEANTCQSEYTECCSDVCSTVSSCCSCKTTEPDTPQTQPCKKNTKNKVQHARKEVQVSNNQTDKNCQEEVDKEHQVMKANMEEMNTKLITTSELLKERLRELEDEIETFRKENVNLNKMKEEVDLERQKFYEEKSNFEKKFNEEKILSEYYLAEEKDKLNKQKQIYERYVREMRGRLNKKEKDEVVNLKQEISNLKDEIRLKDAKSTSMIARLRNQIKLIEKEKTELQKEVEKLKKENRRIHHSNGITRRLTNMKYLEQINKKLSNMNKEPLPEVESCNDVKYKAFEIERQSRSRKIQPTDKGAVRPRAKSVPNLKVQSRYAKYFSQRDAISERDGKMVVTIERHDSPQYISDDDEIKLDAENSDESVVEDNESSDNNLEKIYQETFRSKSPDNKSTKSATYLSDNNSAHSTNGFFLRKSNSASSTRDSKSPVNISTSPYSTSLRQSKSPISVTSHRSSQRSAHASNHLAESIHTYRSNSPSISNQSSQRSATVIHKEIYQDQLRNVSPEPTTSRTSLNKTNLNPTEYKKPDGSRELRFPNGNVKHISADGKYCKFVYYNGDVKENFYSEGRIKYYYAESKTYHTTHPDGHEVLEFPDGQVEKRYKDGSSEVRLPNGSVRYHDPKNEHVREEWRFPDGSALTVSANGERRIVFPSGQIEVHANDHKRREFPDGTVKLVYNDGTSETRYASGRVRIKDKHGNLIMDSAAR